MPTIQLSAELTDDDLIKVVDQLNEPELDEFVSRVLALRARRHTSPLSIAESELLLKINEGIPDALHDRYWELIEKRRDEKLKPSEHKELLQLTEQVERLEVKRVENLIKLAMLRGITIDQLMQDLGIQTPPYV